MLIPCPLLLEYGIYKFWNSTNPKRTLSITAILESHLCKDEEFMAVLNRVAEEESIRPADIYRQALKAYSELSKHAHGITSPPILRRSQHAPADFAAFKAIFRFLRLKGCIAIDVLEE